MQPGNGTALTFTNEYGATSAGYIRDSSHVVATDWGNMVGTLEATANGAVEIDWGQWNTAWTGGLWTKVTLIHGGYGYPVDGYPPPTPTPAPTLTPVPAVATGDAGFEQVAVGAGRFQYRPAGSPWTFTGGAGISGNGSGFTSGNPPAPEGAQVAFLQGTGAISQTVAGWAAGTYHQLLRRPARQHQARGRTSRSWSTASSVGTFTPSGTSTRATPPPRSPSPPGRTRSRSRAWTPPAATTPPSSTTSPSRSDPVADVADAGFEQVAVGTGQFQYRPDRLALDLHRRRRRLGQRQRLHRGQPAGARGRPGRLPPGHRRVQPGGAGWAAGSYTLSFCAAQRGNDQASRQDFQVLVDGVGGGHVHALGHVVPALHHRRVHGRGRVAHDRLPGPGHRRRRQHRLRR